MFGYTVSKIPLMRIDRLNSLNSYENVCLQSGNMNKFVLIYYKVINATYIEILPATALRNHFESFFKYLCYVWKKNTNCVDCDLPSTLKARSNSSHINSLLLVISYRAKFSYQLLRTLDYFK